MKRHVVVLLSDPHAGHDAGLTNPDAKIIDLHTGADRAPTMSARAEWLWECYSEDVAAALAFAGRDPLHLCVMGDATHGNLKPDDTAERALHAQMTLALANLEPWRAGKVTAIEYVTGTSWHDFGDGSTTALLTRWTVDTWKRAQVRGHFHPLVDVDGALFDLAHHGPSAGATEWVKGDALRRHVRNRMLQDLQRGQTPAAVFAFGHFHQRALATVDVEHGAELYQSVGLICPPYCLPGAYGIKAGRSPAYVGVGLTVWEVLDGKLGRRLDLYHEFEMRRKPDG